MEKKIRLTLTSRQTDETGDVTVTKQAAEGEYFEKNGSLYILYEDSPEEDGPVSKNIIKLKDSVLELTKRGGVSTRMVFAPGREYLTDYITPCGCLKMGISTHFLEVNRKEDLLKIELRYLLSWDGIPVSHCTMTICAASLP